MDFKKIKNTKSLFNENKGGFGFAAEQIYLKIKNVD
jgi:hypothetical protein